MNILNRIQRLSAAAILVALSGSVVRADSAQGGDYTLTKNLLNATGSAHSRAGDVTLAFALGEPLGGASATVGDLQLQSGYFGGRYGTGKTFQLTKSQVGTKTFFQENVQVGVALDAAVQLQFSDAIQENTIRFGIQVNAVTDHLGQPMNAPVAYTPQYDTSNKTVTLTPDTPWLPNTYYSLLITPELLSSEGFGFETVLEIPFVTILDPHQENVVQHPIITSASAQAFGNASGPTLHIHLPAETLADFSMVLVSQDPSHQPLQVDPKIVQQATARAIASGGTYRQPLAVREIAAYNAAGDRVATLSKAVDVSFSFDTSLSASSGKSTARPQTLAVWALDQAHQLWVKIPESAHSADGHTVGAPVNTLSAFALMGSASGSAADSYAFPVPWRPHGPTAGTGVGQTGTENAGITFAALPSECSIRIYTLSGELVRTLHHSDAATGLPEEIWDVKTSGGSSVASGVYLWRVESSTDGKNGKLMVIR